MNIPNHSEILSCYIILGKLQIVVCLNRLPGFMFIFWILNALIAVSFIGERFIITSKIALRHVVKVLNEHPKLHSEILSCYIILGKSQIFLCPNRLPGFMFMFWILNALMAVSFIGESFSITSKIALGHVVITLVIPR